MNEVRKITPLVSPVRGHAPESGDLTQFHTESSLIIVFTLAHLSHASHTKR